MLKIIISYRRADTQDIAMRIRDRLSARYGKQSVFTDIDSIPVGSDFLKHINRELAQCDALLAIVGPHWLRGRDSGAALEEETDYVRLEVEGALKRDIPVVPIVVGGAKMPRPSDLPESMRAFSYRNAAEVDSGVRFQDDMDRLIRSLDAHFAEKAATSATEPPEPGATKTTQQGDQPEAGKGTDQPRSALVDDGASAPSLLAQAAAAFQALRKAVPAVDFALGFAVVAALAALIIGFLGYARAALIIFAGMVVASLFVAICVRVFSGRNSALTLAGIATVWAVALFFITFLAFTATAVAFKWPPGWASILGFAVEPVRKVSVCPPPDQEMQPASCGQPDGDYIVVNIRWDDADRGLVVRDAGSMQGIQLGVIPPNGTEIKVPPCDTEWCQVQCGGLKGWSRKRYLSPRSLALRTVTGIAADDPHGLSVRTGPHPTCRSVGSLPPQGRDVILHGCEASPIDRSTWCRVTYKNFSGWVPDGYLQRPK